jgi:carboxypeptidase C (cathepsin A)
LTGTAGALPKEESKNLTNVLSDLISVTRHSIDLKGRILSFVAHTGYLAMSSPDGKPKANMFFVAYIRETQEGPTRRPITFAYNGGPGASSAWLHLGALGPKRVALAEDRALPPPYGLTDNEYTWLDFTDLVFIDPAGTGYSRPAPGIDPKEFYGVEEDIRSVGDFIRLFTTEYGRWLSPKFIAGESYGTTRTAGLSGYLQNKLGMTINGLVLISSVLDFQTISFAPGNNLPYLLYLPTYTPTAWFHKKLPPPLQKDIKTTRDEVERFALNDYLLALAKGGELSEREQERIADKLADYTGLSKAYIRKSNLKVTRKGFMEKLLSGENRRVGILDSRVTGTYKVSDFMEDPSVFAVVGPLTAGWNDYVRKELNYKNPLPYTFLSEKANRSWDWGSAMEGYVNVTDTLELAMNENQSLKVFIASGYYDLDTPYFAAKYVASQLDIGPALRKNLTLAYYEGGHQMYTHLPSLAKLKEDVASFYKETLAEKKP